jgi:hypothetical protein
VGRIRQEIETVYAISVEPGQAHSETVSNRGGLNIMRAAIYLALALGAIISSSHYPEQYDGCMRAAWAFLIIANIWLAAYFIKKNF